jgi:hypothetical protein
MPTNPSWEVLNIFSRVLHVSFWEFISKMMSPLTPPSPPAYRQAGMGEKGKVRGNFKYLW